MSREVTSLVKRSYDLFGPHQWQFLLFKCTLEVNYSMFCILLPWCKCHVSIHINFLCKILILYIPFSCCHVIVHCWPCLVSYVKLYNWYAIHFKVLLVHNETIIVREKFGIISIIFCYPFHSLILRSRILTTPMNVL